MKNAIIIVNALNESAKQESSEVSRFLSENGVTSRIFLFSGSESADFSDCECAITLGGDGTVLFAARSCAEKGIPIFPINFGTFGFIAEIYKTGWRSELKKFLLEGAERCEMRSLLEVDVLRGGKSVFSQVALNDAVVSGRVGAKTVYLDVNFNGIPFGKFSVDGVIVSTATGSTAYSVAAGGPIVDPSLDVFILTPICPFTLSNRPLVLPSDGVLEFLALSSRSENLAVTVDGQIKFDLEKGDLAAIRKSPKKVALAGMSQAGFYSALRSKLHWSGGRF